MKYVYSVQWDCRWLWLAVTGRTKSLEVFWMVSSQHKLIWWS